MSDETEEDRDVFQTADEELADGKVNPRTLREVLAQLRPARPAPTKTKESKP